MVELCSYRVSGSSKCNSDYTYPTMRTAAWAGGGSCCWAHSASRPILFLSSSLVMRHLLRAASCIYGDVYVAASIRGFNGRSRCRRQYYFGCELLFARQLDREQCACSSRLRNVRFHSDSRSDPFGEP